MAHVDHALAAPLRSLPERQPESIRRTSHVDMIGLPGGRLELRGVAHDDGAHLESVAMCAVDRTLTSLTLGGTSPLSDAEGQTLVDHLQGRLVGRGFRAAVDEVCQPNSLLSVLLCELPVAALLSGYANLYTGAFPRPIPQAMLDRFPVDICAGWAAPGSFMLQIRRDRDMPTPSGPVAPDLVESWHSMPDLAPGSMRRQRLLDRTGDAVWAMFRDTYARPDGVVTILHEYSVEATLSGHADFSEEINPSGETVIRCEATARVLPWAECPQAAASAGRVVGTPVSGLRALVKDTLVGTSTCTHLNDLLSSLSQAGELVPSRPTPR